MMEDLILFGGGGHCRSCIDVIEEGKEYHIAGIIDVAEKVNQSVLGYGIIGTDDDLNRLVKKCRNFLVTIGQIGSAEVRVEKFDLLKRLGAVLPVIISPLAHVSRRSIVGEGTIIMHNVVVNAGARIGRNCIINTGAIIEHDAVIGDHCHISTAAVVNGGTVVGAKTFLGSNSETKQYIEIGEGSLVNSGISVRKSVPPGKKILLEKSRH
ncbi:MAG TPA: NeuD/PglB/VioB family sugar acetyltransferase [Syntrophorhabdaceae bacterium]|nr:NeuD/PglB/VioB family sugar acetyltransferase [Syntrophorhabdaceae bacterium]HQM80938.1 NeuD/PglB/VioB family sugar acetyltransferase [Syntrophorhabdaceae bacterium]